LITIAHTFQPPANRALFLSNNRKTISFLATATLAFAALVPLCMQTAHAQRPRFGDPFQTGGSTPGSIITAPQFPSNLPQLPQLQQPQIQLPQGQGPQLQLPQLQLPQFHNGAAQLPNFLPQQAQPYIAQGGVLPTLDLPRTSLPDPSNYNLQQFPLFSNRNSGRQQLQVLPPPPQQLPQNFNIPQNGFQQPTFPTQGFPQPGLQQPGLGQIPNQGYQGYQGQYNPYQNRWPYEGTGTDWLPSIDWSWPRQQWQRFQTEFLPRVLERPRFRHTYLHGSNRNGINGNELDINDFELATTLTRPNFLGSGQPLRISPGAVFSFWDGPETESTGFDLPSKAVGAYLGLDHVTDLTKTSGFESNVTVGIYSDYENLSSDSFRLTGRLLGWQRINSYTVGKLGVEYLDRIRIKLLPAVGLFMSPNPDMKLDLYFPRTKLSHRIPNLGEYEAWGYVGGEYGGGSWAIERIDGTDDQVDINDVRAFAGMEWIGPRRVTGFVDFGYAFEREIVYRSDPINDLNLQDTLFVRTGLAF